MLIHRQTNQGHDSAKLQKAAADNRNRLAALVRAAALWQHISEGYAQIAEKTAAQKREETELAKKVCNEERKIILFILMKRATLNLSVMKFKRQNILQIKRNLIFCI